MKIKIVDATKIRNSLDTDFSGVATHEDFLFIPKGELWIDKYLKREKALFIKLAKLEHAMRKRPFKEIRAAAAQQFTQKPYKEPAVQTIIKQGLLNIRYVDGSMVRAYLDPYFLLGGHGLVYPYIPKNEIWIDTKADPADMKYTLIHELDELQRMRTGQSYHDAHDFALATERAARRKDGVARFIRN